jgi:hypothetical protein
MNFYFFNPVFCTLLISCSQLKFPVTVADPNASKYVLDKGMAYLKLLESIICISANTMSKLMIPFGYAWAVSDL